MADYVLYIRSEAVASYRAARSSEKRSLERFFDFLEDNPFTKGEMIERDNVGRAVEVKFVSGYKIVYWADHPAKEVKILKLERVSRR
jgi:hypothetical protein